MKRLFITTTIAVVAYLSSAWSLAALETRRGQGEDSRVVLASNEIVEDNLLITGDTVVVNGVVTGNLIALGRIIELRGEVHGDVLTASAETMSSGRIGGNWVSFSRTFTSSATVDRSLAAFAETVESTGEVGDDLAAFASKLALMGPVGKDAYLFASDAEALSNIGRDLNIWAGASTVGPEASVGGDVIARVGDPEDLTVDPGSTVAGDVRTLLHESEEEVSRYARFDFYIGLLLSIMAALVTGLILYWLAPGLLEWRPDSPQSVALTGGVGFLVLVAAPVASVLAMVTVIGLPVGLITLALWASLLYLAKVAVAIPVGAALLHKERPAEDLRAFLACLALGLALFALLRLIPYLGGLLAFAVALVGMGALAIQGRNLWRASQRTVSD